ncbi:FtsX-like permease family protein [bacterium]|nr:FtsX-like permease family protein [bacterium]MBU1435615.1 FtsX-like permease family protein [bacterium]MBU1502461.1 FtsX-like permease family protein [bacterium]
MKSKINFYLIEFAINSLLRQKAKSIFITVVITFLTFLLASVFFITNSIKYELNATLDSLPQITLQDVRGGRIHDIDIKNVEKILAINGVSDASSRVWGYYYFEMLDVYFTVVGIEEFETALTPALASLSEKFDFNSIAMFVGAGVKKKMSERYYKEYFNFIKPDGSMKKVNIAGVFESDLELEANDMIVMSKQNVREIFAMSEERATDISVHVSNPKEIATVAQKIKEQFPSFKVITKDDLKLSYENMFNYKSGVFLALFVVAIFTFFIIIYDKLSGLSSEEKREVGILKAVGWRVEDVLKEKFYEAGIISVFSYLLGIALALAFVYLLQAPLLREIFIGYSDLKVSFRLPFVMDLQTLLLVFFLTIPIYIAATIIPSWRVASLETDEVIR